MLPPVSIMGTYHIPSTSSEAVGCGNNNVPKAIRWPAFTHIPVAAASRFEETRHRTDPD
jgi:hypothetical protein